MFDFSSKERFGEVLLSRYIDNYLVRLDVLFQPDGSTARQRLMTYWSYWNASQCGVSADNCSISEAGTKCLIVKLSAEVADISDAMRLILRDGTDQVVRRIALCLEDARQDGSVAQTLDTAATALTLYQLWLGASLLAKLHRDASHFEHALIATEHILDCSAR